MFTQGQSTVTTLSVCKEFVFAAFDRGFQVDDIYLVFSKAFYKLSDLLPLVTELRYNCVDDPLLL